jgi:hypothetical protein
MSFLEWATPYPNHTNPTATNKPARQTMARTERAANRKCALRSDWNVHQRSLPATTNAVTGIDSANTAKRIW